MLLTACNSQLSVEKDAKIKISVHNETYGTQLQQLWNETYPQHQDIIEITTEEDTDADLFFIEDTKIASVIDQCLEIKPTMEIPVHESFNRVINRVKKVYYPIVAKGEYYYAIDTTNREQMDLSTFDTFERMQSLENSFYYIENPIFQLFLLSSDLDYFPGNTTSKINFEGKSFKQALTDYLTIRKNFPSGESTFFDRWFIDHTYASGFVAEWMQLDENEAVNGAKYQIRPMPTINGHALKTTARSFGYVINESTLYPKTAQMLIELMHTQKGIQLLCNDDDYIPLLNQNDVEKFTFENIHIQEKAKALVASMPHNLVAIDETGRGAIDFLTLESTLEMIDSCDENNIDACISELSQNYQNWIENK